MAATWTVKIEVTNIDSKLCNVVGTRTNGTDIRVYTLSGVSVDTHDTSLANIKTRVVDTLYGMYSADIATTAKIAAMIAGWESALITALNAKEI